ncbi:MAG: DUF1361 domain-containing protein [Saprospiraceae bacterium]|nr:DUF1361 domain-containing protein [Saprospiraceae bacterium]
MSWLKNYGTTGLLVITLLNLIILMIRNFILDDNTYNFIIFNLFLGVIPFVIAYFSTRILKGGKIIWILLASGLWLLFYPNSPYMITDLIHVEPESKAVIYDTLIIFSYAILSLFFGFFSIKLIHSLWLTVFSPRMAGWMVILSILLSSFGIYLGRILRLNSWDLFTHPGKVVIDIFDHLWPVTDNPQTYYIILLYTFIQSFILILTVDLDR